MQKGKVAGLGVKFETGRGEIVGVQESHLGICALENMLQILRYTIPLYHCEGIFNR
jgi:hypothetical protein